jgi:hypothetical protein
MSGLSSSKFVPSESPKKSPSYFSFVHISVSRALTRATCASSGLQGVVWSSISGSDPESILFMRASGGPYQQPLRKPDERMVLTSLTTSSSPSPSLPNL